MTESHLIAPDRRLAKMLREPGGLSVSTAIANAAERVESVRESTLTALEHMVQDLAAGLAAARADRLPEAYKRCVEIVGLAGVFARHDLARIADSLCDLMLAWTERPTPQGGAPREPVSSQFWDAARLHASAMLALFRAEIPPDQREETLQALRILARRAEPALKSAED